MAKSKLNYTRSITDKIMIKGTLSEDGTFISYMDEDDVLREINVSDCLMPFCGTDIDFSVMHRFSEDMDVSVEEDYNVYQIPNASKE